MSKDLNGRFVVKLRDSCISIAHEKEIILAEGTIWKFLLSASKVREKRADIEEYISQLPESDDPMKLCYDVNGNIWTADMQHVDAIMQLRDALIKLDKEDFYVEEQREMPSSNR